MDTKVLLASATLALAQGLAHANSSSALVSDINFTVTDLAPDDGIAASFGAIFAESYVSFNVSNFLHPGPNYPSPYFLNGGPVYVPYGEYDSSGGSGVLAGNASVAADADGAAFASFTASSDANFIATPHSSIEVSGTYWLTVNGTGSASSSFCLADQCSGASLGAGAKRGSFDFFYTNDTDAYQYVAGSAYASAYVSGVPEPQPAMLLAAGLLALAAHRRINKT